MSVSRDLIGDRYTNEIEAILKRCADKFNSLFKRNENGVCYQELYIQECIQPLLRDISHRKTLTFARLLEKSPLHFSNIIYEVLETHNFYRVRGELDITSTFGGMPETRSVDIINHPDADCRNNSSSCGINATALPALELCSSAITQWS